MPSIALHRFAFFTACCTALLVFAGGLVTSKDAGLSVPDWPLSYGKLMPPMVGNVRFEHGHRMLATFVGMLTIVLSVWLHRKEKRAALRRLGYLALAAVVLQGLLGGLTVLHLLPLGISVAHATLGQTFFCLVVAIALLTSPGWARVATRSVSPQEGRVRFYALGLTALVFVQLVVGAVMRHSGAGLAIPDFPLMHGGLLPKFAVPGAGVHFAHRLLALGILIAALVTCWRFWAEPQASSLRRPAAFVLLLVLLQVILGAMTIWSLKAVVPTTFHVLNGALILASSLVLTLRSFRLLRPHVVEALPTAVLKEA